MLEVTETDTAVIGWVKTTAELVGCTGCGLRAARRRAARKAATEALAALVMRAMPW